MVDFKKKQLSLNVPADTSPAKQTCPLAKQALEVCEQDQSHSHKSRKNQYIPLFPLSKDIPKSLSDQPPISLNFLLYSQRFCVISRNLVDTGLPRNEWIDQEAPGCWIKNENTSNLETHVKSTCLMPFGLSVSGPCCCLACLMNSTQSGFHLTPEKSILIFICLKFPCFCPCLNCLGLENCLIQTEEQYSRTSIHMCLFLSGFQLLCLTRSDPPEGQKLQVEFLQEVTAV